MIIQWIVVMLVAVALIFGAAFAASVIDMYRRLRLTGYAWEIIHKRLRSDLSVTHHNQSPKSDSLVPLIGRQVWFAWSFRWGPAGESFGEIAAIDTSKQEQSILISSDTNFHIGTKRTPGAPAQIKFFPNGPCSILEFERQSIDGKIVLPGVAEAGECELIVLVTSPRITMSTVIEGK